MNKQSTVFECLLAAMFLFLTVGCTCRLFDQNVFDSKPTIKVDLPIPSPASSNSNALPTFNGNMRAANSNAAPVSGGVLNAKALSLPKPPYPAAAKAVRASGAVNVQVTVDESGNVVSAEAVSGHALLRAAATAAARTAKFAPAQVGGAPRKVTGVIVYNFTPE